MNLFGQFLLYNLLPSILIGFITWLVVIIALKFLPIHNPNLRLSFLGLPVIKSALALLGMNALLPWPPSLVSSWQENALPLGQVLPPLLIWSAVLILAYFLLVSRVRRQLLQHACVEETLAPRLEQSLQRVRNRYSQNPVPRCDAAFCSFSTKAPTPQLLVSDKLRSPTALVEGGRPVILFPSPLVGELTDKELDGAMAHELGHFVLRRNHWCSTTLLRRLVLISPAAAIVSAHLNREEEMACDDVAVSVVGKADVYASTLVKSYRFAQAQSTPVGGLVRLLPQLLGLKTHLSARVERLVQPPPNLDGRYQYLLACFLWFGLSLLFFSGW